MRSIVVGLSKSPTAAIRPCGVRSSEASRRLAAGVTQDFADWLDAWLPTLKHEAPEAVLEAIKALPIQNKFELLPREANT